jgi:carboxylate-amine ligase
VAALAALTQCLVEHYSRELDAGREIPSLQPWFVRENKWRAARYGMDAIIICNPGGDERLVTDDLDDLLTTLDPISEDYACNAELGAVRNIIERGASYQRQLRVANANPEDLRAVVTHLVHELQQDPRPQT